jgi:hypothetical protein
LRELTSYAALRPHRHAPVGKFDGTGRRIGLKSKRCSTVNIGNKGDAGGLADASDLRSLNHWKNWPVALHNVELLCI